MAEGSSSISDIAHLRLSHALCLTVMDTLPLAALRSKSLLSSFKKGSVSNLTITRCRHARRQTAL